MDFLEKSHTILRPERPYSEADFDGSHAAPVSIIGKGAKKQSIRRQDALIEKFGVAVQYEIGHYVVPSVVNFVGMSIISRIHEREGMNGIAFNNRLYRYPHVWEVPDRSAAYVLRACSKSHRGEGSIDENRSSVLAYGQPSGELGNITIIDMFRAEEEAPMWDATSELVGHDARPNPKDMRGLVILGYDRDILTSQHLGAVRIGLKRTIGPAPGNLIVKGRTTANINTSPSSGFDQDIVAALREAEYQNRQMAKLERESGFQLKLDRINVAEIPEFSRAVNWLIRSNLSPGKILARNETVYGVNPAVVERIKQLRSWRDVRS